MLYPLPEKSPVPVPDVPNPKQTLFLSYKGSQMTKISGIKYKQNRTDTVCPIRRFIRLNAASAGNEGFFLLS